MDVLAKYFMRNTNKRSKAIREAVENVEKLPAYKKRNGDYYVKVMEEIHTNGDAFLVDEIHRTQKLIFGSISLNKKDELTTRRNILQQFNKNRRDEL